MNKSLGFVGRNQEIKSLRQYYTEAKHVIIIGSPGIGKTALLRRIRQDHSLLLCEETRSLRRICDDLERQLGWKHRKMNVLERKNRLLDYLARRGEPVTFDNLSLTPPRIARFIENLSENIPVWISCRSDRAKDIGAVWQHLYKFLKIVIPPLSQAETKILIEGAIAMGNIQPDAIRYIARLYQLTHGNPRILEELLIELSARHYDIGESFGFHLLDLDRRIREIASETSAALDRNLASKKFETS